MGFYDFPHTRNYDSDLGYLITKMKELLNGFSGVTRDFAALNTYLRDNLPEAVQKELKVLLSDTELRALIADTVNQWLVEHPEATTTVEDGAITFDKINYKLKPLLQKARAKMTKNIQLTSTSTNARIDAGYEYITRGRDAIRDMLDDLKAMGVEEIYPIVNLNLSANNTHYISGGASYLTDVNYMHTYAHSIGLICNLIRIMGKPVEESTESYKTQLRNVLEALSDNFTHAIVLNERETLLESNEQFGMDCLHIAKDMGYLVSISITNRLVLSANLLREMDFISYNLYQPVQFDVNRIVYDQCVEQLERQRDIFSYFHSFNKDIIIAECGCRDCYWSLGNPAGSTVPDGYYNYTAGVANAYLLDNIYRTYGDDVLNIAEWYSQGFNVHDNTNLTVLSRERNKAVINFWRGV